MKYISLEYTGLQICCTSCAPPYMAALGKSAVAIDRQIQYTYKPSVRSAGVVSSERGKLWTGREDIEYVGRKRRL